ncbi:MAG: DUF3267 domain-containing protein [Clostridiales bacterium]|nr:DUF3267 domain-containing protein [Clostridiales bacterium]
MKLIYNGKFNGDMESLPCKEHKPGAVKFKEFNDPKKMAIFFNLLALVIAAIFLGLFLLRAKVSTTSLMAGAMITLLILFPHELLHGICFKEEVYLYTYWRKGMLFVTGPESMSKGRFIFMSLLPNVIFGFIPYTIAMIFPSLDFLGVFGAISISGGVGDYYNIFNAITQMPKGAKTYLHKFNSYWYMD